MKGRSSVGNFAEPVSESKLFTNWMRGASTEPSGHAGGGRMKNSDWLLAEKAALAVKGVVVEIAENPGIPGYFALVRA